MDPKTLKNEAPGTALLSISGMTCDGCAKTVTRILSRVPGVTGVNVDFGTARASVVGKAHPEALVAAVQAAGYRAQLSQHDTTAEERNERG